MKKDQREIFVTLKQRRFLLWTAATRATAVARHGFDCCFSLSSSRSLSLFPPSFFFVPLRRVATHENSCYFTAGRRAARRLAAAAAQTRIRIRSFSLRVPHAYPRGPGASISYGASTSIRVCNTTVSPSIRPWPRASHFSCAESARLSKNHNATFTRTDRCSRALQIVRTRT